MAGIFFLFVMMVAVGSLMDGYVKELNRKEPTPTIHFSDEDKPTRPKIEMVEGELFKK